MPDRTTGPQSQPAPPATVTITKPSAQQMAEADAAHERRLLAGVADGIEPQYREHYPRRSRTSPAL